MPPRTIDNLGLDASTRYAEDKKLFDEKLLKEARAIPPATQVDVTTPSFPSEFDLLFETQKRHAFWALFSPPAKFGEQKRQIFTNLMIPSLGEQDKKEALQERVRSIVKKRKKEEKIVFPSWEEEREEKDRLTEQEILLKLLEKLIVFEKDYLEINGRRGQYHRG